MNHITAELDSLLTVGEDGGVLCGHLVSGRPSLFHWATVASSVSMETGSRSAFMGIST